MTLTSIGKLSDRFNIINGVITVPDTVVRSIEGVVYETSFMYWVAPYACVIADIKMYLASNPSATGSVCSLQVMKNSTLETESILSAQQPMQITEVTPILNSLYSATALLNPARVTLAAGDVIQFRINRADAGSVDFMMLMKVNYT